MDKVYILLQSQNENEKEKEVQRATNDLQIEI